MDMLPSPFTPGQMPRVLVGRAAEQHRIRTQLARVATFGEMGGAPLVLHAPRGLGKTSLLRDAESQAAELGFVSAWVSCTKGQSFLSDLAAGIHHGLRRAEVLTAQDLKIWNARIASFGVEVGLPGLKVGAEVRPRPPATSPVGTVAPTEELMREAAGACRRRGGAGILVLVDELHAARHDELGVLLNAVQNLAGDHEPVPMAVFAAGLPSTPETIMRAATFGERCEFLPLDRLDEADARRVLVQPAAEIDVAWTDAALQAALDVGQGYPYLLQLVGDTTWQAAEPTASSRLGVDHVRDGGVLMERQLTAMCRARWESAAPLEQELLAAMAAHGREIVPREAIATSMGRESRAISVPRARLIDRGIIEPAGRGLLRFTLPGMAAWIRESRDG